MPTSTSEEELCINGMSFSRCGPPSGVGAEQRRAGTRKCCRSLQGGALPLPAHHRPPPPWPAASWLLLSKRGASTAAPTTAPHHALLSRPPLRRRRDSKWANSALVVTVQPSDWAHLEAAHGPLAGMALQQEWEREAARRGGGAFAAPAQTVADFLERRAPAAPLPPSSYRLGITPSPLHDFYPPHMTAAFYAALARFDRQLPGFAGCAPGRAGPRWGPAVPFLVAGRSAGPHPAKLAASPALIHSRCASPHLPPPPCSEEALLHAAETRTSAPLRIERSPESLESISLGGLYPCGEGAAPVWGWCCWGR